jgi:hypothetical protein
MALRGQLIELKNQGRYQFHMKVGIYDDFLDNALYLFSDTGDENEGVPLDKDIEVYECRLDFSNPEKPASFPLGQLKACMDIYEQHEGFEGLAYDLERMWKIGFIVDTIISEAFATDLLEVIHGDDFRNESPGHEKWRSDALSAQSPPSADKRAGDRHGGRCPDCGAVAKRISVPERDKGNTFACEVCGRFFTV